MTLDSVILVYEQYRHLDRPIERLPDGDFVNVILKDFWHAIKDHIEKYHPEVIP